MEYIDFYERLEIFPKIIDTYEKESKYGGYPNEPSGSVWEKEGKSIYNLIRFYKPKKILEIGNFRGVSTNHILQAVEDNNIGEVTLVDISELLDYTKIHNTNFDRHIMDSLDFLQKEIQYDFIVLDGCHEYNHVKKELELIYKNNKISEYYLWVHDYFVLERSDVGVKKAWDETESSINYFSYKVKGLESDCGFVFSKVVL